MVSKVDSKAVSRATSKVTSKDRVLEVKTVANRAVSKADSLVDKVHLTMVLI